MRNRNNNPVAVASRGLYSVELTKSERLIVSWVLGSIEGMGRDDSRKAAAVIEELDLENLGDVTPEQLNDAESYKLSGYEIRFVADELDKMWDQKKVRASQAKPAVSLYDKLKAAMETKETDNAAE